MSSDSPRRRNLLAVNLSLTANVLLAAVKTAVGILGNSPALLADGINSTSDAAYLIVVRVFMGQAHKPPDREHPFGHQQLETIAALVIGAFVMTTGVAIFWDAVNDVYQWMSGIQQLQGANVVALWVALANVCVKIALMQFTAATGRRTGSIAVLALARDHRNDVFSISTAAVGIFMARLGYAWLDPTAAAVVALVIFYTGVQIVRESSADLMDTLPSDEVRRHIRRLLEAVPGVRDVEEIHVHRIGPYLLVQVVLGIDGQLSVKEGDRIASRAEETLTENLEYLRRVSVHYHPSRRAADAG